MARHLREEAMVPLSVVLIARDEADRIGDAIRSVPFADEVLVLDSGSTDGTPGVARDLGARVVETDWPGHVDQKNRAFALARNTWVLSLDADERVSPTLARSIERAFTTSPDVAGFRFNRRNHYLGRPLRGGGWYPDARIRLARRDRARWTGLDPHDILEVDGEVRFLEGDLDHHPYRDLSDHLRTLDRYSARFAEVYDGEVRWVDLLFRPPWAFFRAWVLRAGFRDGVRGLLVAGLGATYVLVKWARARLSRGHP